MEVMITHNLTIDLDKPSLANNIILKKGSHNTRRLVFNIISNGKSVDLKEIHSMAIKAIKPDGTIVHDEVKLEDGKAYYDIIEQMTSVAGEVECELEIFSTEGGMMDSPTFYLTAQDNVYNTDKIVSEDEKAGIKAYVQAAYGVLEETQKLQSKFELTNGTMEEVLEELEDSKSEYVTYIEELKKKVADGYFNGAQGIPGENGTNGVIIEAEGITGFQIEDGYLMCYTEE